MVHHRPNQTLPAPRLTAGRSAPGAVSPLTTRPPACLPPPTRACPAPRSRGSARPSTPHVHSGPAPAARSSQSARLPGRRPCAPRVAEETWRRFRDRGGDGGGRPGAGAGPGTLRLRDTLRLAPVRRHLGARRTPGSGPREHRARGRLQPRGAAGGGPGPRGAGPRPSVPGLRGLPTGAGVERAERSPACGASRWCLGGGGRAGASVSGRWAPQPSASSRRPVSLPAQLR